MKGFKKLFKSLSVVSFNFYTQYVDLTHTIFIKALSEFLNNRDYLKVKRSQWMEVTSL